MPILTIQNLTKQFEGVAALQKLSLSFSQGEITGIIGPNGSGKSTLVNVLTGLIPMDGGQVIVADAAALTEIAPEKIAGMGLTRTFQEVRLFEQMSVLDNLLVTLTERSVWKSLVETTSPQQAAQAEASLRRVDLWEKRDELAQSLSYGQRKLLEIARVLGMIKSQDMKLVFFDEPFAGLFPEMITLIIQILKEITSKNIAVVLIEHNMEIIRELCDRLIVLDAGEVLAEGSPAEVLARRDVVKAYLGD